MKIRIENDGQPAYATRITNAETGEQITNAFRFEVDVSAGKEPQATLHTYGTAINWTGEAEVKAHCPVCGSPFAEDIDPETVLFAFMGWLTSRDEVSGPFSSHHEASQAAQLIRAFCDAQGWKTDEARFARQMTQLKGKYPE